MRCYKCGKTIDDTATFCRFCGTSQGSGATTVLDDSMNPFKMPEPLVEESAAPQAAPQEKMADNGWQNYQPTYQQPAYPQQPVYQQPAYPQQGYPQQPVYGYPQQPTPTVPGKGLGITAMIVGIVALVFLCVWYICLPCAVVGVILGAIAKSKAKAVGMKNGMATAGIVCSCIALGLSILWVILIGGLVAEIIGIGGLASLY